MTAHCMDRMCAMLRYVVCKQRYVVCKQRTCSTVADGQVIINWIFFIGWVQNFVSSEPWRQAHGSLCFEPGGWWNGGWVPRFRPREEPGVVCLWPRGWEMIAYLTRCCTYARHNTDVCVRGHGGRLTMDTIKPFMTSPNISSVKIRWLVVNRPSKPHLSNATKKYTWWQISSATTAGYC